MINICASNRYTVASLPLDPKILLVFSGSFLICCFRCCWFQTRIRIILWDPNHLDGSGIRNILCRNGSGSDLLLWSIMTFCNQLLETSCKYGRRRYENTVPALTPMTYKSENLRWVRVSLRSSMVSSKVHFHAYGACLCPWCMCISMMHVYVHDHAACPCPCCMSVSMLRV
jgi:hypothetical protein